MAWQAETSDKEEGEWQRKGATLSDTTARTEFGLTQDEIVQAIRAGKLHYRHNSIFGNPFLRLLRREVEALVKQTHGTAFLKDQQAKTELACINRELRRLTTQIAALEERKAKLREADERILRAGPSRRVRHRPLGRKADQGDGRGRGQRNVKKGEACEGARWT